jgi:hypothetical protein
MRSDVETDPGGRASRTLVIRIPRFPSISRVSAPLAAAKASVTGGHMLTRTVSTVLPLLTALALGLPNAAGAAAERLTAGDAAGAGSSTADGGVIDAPSTPPAWPAMTTGPALPTSATAAFALPPVVGGDGLPGALSPTASAAPAIPLPTGTRAAGADTGGLTSSGIPTRVQAAYVAAAARAATTMPTCHIGWSVLAGIGRVESDHGRFGGAVIGTDGKVRPGIHGIRLDGSGGTAAIRDTDGGVLDGDRMWDRAVGPMQFLPGTWRAYAVDGDGDGVADPQDVDDAAATAARYLCGGGDDLSTVTGRWKAAFRYNHSAGYANLVTALAVRYATQVGTLPVPASPPSRTTSPAPTRSPSVSRTNGSPSTWTGGGTPTATSTGGGTPTATSNPTTTGTGGSPSPTTGGATTSTSITSATRTEPTAGGSAPRA